MQNLRPANTATVSELKVNPNKVLNQAGHEPVVILSKNRPLAYLLSPDMFEQIQEQLEDYRLLQAAHQRINDEAISVSIEELHTDIQENRRS